MAITWFEDSFSLWFPKKQLTYEGLKYGVADYVHNKLRTTLNAFFQGQRGFFTYDVVVSSLSTTEFSITENDSGTNVISGMADDEKVFSVTSGAGEITSIPWENSAAVVYSVGIRPQQEVPDFSQDHIRRNAISGKYKYTLGRDRIGEYVNGMTVLSGADAAKTVAVDGDKLVICVDELWEFQGASTESSSHAGVTVYAWLVQPESLDNTVAFKSATVQYDTDTTNSVAYFSVARNFIELDAATGTTFGATSADIAYTNVALFYHGPTITRKTWKDLSADTAYAWIGEITGHAATPTFSNTGQVLLRPNTLDWAYDGPSGSGSGRAIAADSGDVEITNTETDTTGCLKLTRTGATGAYGSALHVLYTSTPSPVEALTLEANTTGQSARVALVNTSEFQLYERYGGTLISMLDVSTPGAGAVSTTMQVGGVLTDPGEYARINLGDPGTFALRSVLDAGSDVLYEGLYGSATVFRYEPSATELSLYLSPDLSTTLPNSSYVRLHFGNDSDLHQIYLYRNGSGDKALIGVVDGTEVFQFDPAQVTFANGGLSANGTIVSSSAGVQATTDFSYVSGKSRTVLINGSDFRIDDEDNANVQRVTGQGLEISGASTSIYAYCDLTPYLPDACTITGYTVYFDHDQDAGPGSGLPDVHTMLLKRKTTADPSTAATQATVTFESETYAGTWGFKASAALTEDYDKSTEVYSLQYQVSNDSGAPDPSYLYMVAVTYTQTYVR